MQTATSARSPHFPSSRVCTSLVTSRRRRSWMSSNKSRASYATSCLSRSLCSRALCVTLGTTRGADNSRTPVFLRRRCARRIVCSCSLARGRRCSRWWSTRAATAGLDLRFIHGRIPSRLPSTSTGSDMTRCRPLQVPVFLNNPKLPRGSAPIEHQSQSTPCWAAIVFRQLCGGLHMPSS
ncbi:hypothetical protein FA95DRAFT_610529 [Auriscalpium vulgare]|uniref:Uncharacterized protein n=1 Tax=Auriscalpium vulgare TaxID=40419 RepID=A0ACB8RDG4_9AGAM|nr:hypothetical protein FA95DRAFT_610529 [Auriscalpium vulgare]